MNFTLFSLCFAFLFVLLLVIKYRKYTRYYSVLDNIPGPKRIPLLGNIFHLHPKGVSFSLHNWFQRFGDIFVFYIFEKPIVVISHPSYVRQVMTNGLHDDKDKLVYGWLEPLIGSGIVVSNGHSWKLQRTITEPVFHLKVLHSFIDMMIVHTHTLLDKITQIENKSWSVIDLDSEFLNLTLDIIGEAAMGVNFGFQNINNDRTVAKSLNVLFKELTLRVQNPMRGYLFFTPSQFQFRHAKKTIRKIFSGVIKERSKNMAKQEENNKNKHNVTLLDLLLQGKDSETGERMSDSLILDNCLTFFVAGYDSTSHTASFCMYLISTHPHVETKVLQEIKSVFFENESMENARDSEWWRNKDNPLTSGLRDPTKLSKLKYLNMVIQEALRLYLPVPMQLRSTSEDTNLGGYLIPKHTAICINIYSLHRNEKIWENHDTFDPERFSKERGQSDRDPFSYGPFSWSKRSCMGNQFALLELKIVLVMLLWRWHFEVDPTMNVGVIQSLTNRPIEGMRMRPIPRRDNFV
eukprot:TRINITY_DN2021_c0_g1_i1.p1 TRINITY_DN2021_c0_g1~~TRINITY_DN2021_c0_g1_i1.p1  ORF type:complete len:520 (-),score=65.85 TRINITY_DN2021_c0_g1_i1:503-2062(-)